MTYRNDDQPETLPDKWSIPFDLGFSVIPVEPHGKKPLGEWKRYMTSAADRATVAGWAANNNCNVGIITGKVSGAIILDFDKAEAEAEAHRLGMPDTVTVTTGRGRHYYFAYTDHPVCKPRDFPAGMDVQSDRKFVVAPGSVHPNGTTYEWENDPLVYPLANLPEWLLGSGENEPQDARGDEEVAKGPIVTRELLAHLTDALQHISAVDYQEWIAVGQALAALPNDRGRPLFMEWSATCPEKFDLAVAEHHWNTFTADRTSYEAVFAKAQRNGWINPASHRARVTDDGVTLDDFWAHMPSHRYIFSPTGELWPSASVNSRIGPVQNGEDTIAAATWLDRNRAVEQMTWAPGEPPVIDHKLISDGGWMDRQGCRTFNLYRPPIPITGDPALASRWVDHITLVYPNEAEHIIRWLAHRVQRPHEKINHAIVLGGSQGIGKDTLLEPVKNAVGPWNFTEVSPQAMLGRFNGFVKSVILRVSEARDLGDGDRFAFYDHMKAYTAAPPDVLRVDEKHKNEYTVFNVCGVIITSNHKLDGIFLPDDDRRHFVAWSDLTKEDFTPGYWDDLWAWYETGGTGHVAAYLAGLDLSQFAPKAPPPKTAAFFDIVASNRAPEDADLEDALEKLGKPDAVTLAQISDVADCSFHSWLKDRRNSRHVPHRMAECGYERVANPSDARGTWRMFGGKAAIYSRRELTIRDRIIAARDLVAKGREG